MANTFRRIRALISPRWLSEGAGKLVGFSLDLVKDAYVRRLELGHLARFPDQGAQGGPPEALEAIGRDRRVIRGRVETNAEYAARCKQWLVDRRTAGTPFALLKKISEYMGPNAGAVIKTVDSSGNWFRRAADGTQTSHLKKANWNWDDHPERWSRFWVIIHPNAIWSTASASWGGGEQWGGGVAQWGITMPYDDIERIRAIVAEWKPYGTRCVNIIVAFDPASFDPDAAPMSAGLPDGLWGASSKIVGGVSVPSRLASARYLDGV